MRCKRWMLVLLATAALAALGLRAAEAQDAAATRGQSPEAILQATGATADERYEAALRLINRHSPDAEKILSDVLNSEGSDEARLAVARAMANDPDPDPALRDALFALVGTTPAMTEAACGALAGFRLASANVSADVMGRLIDRASAPSKPEYIRNAALRALGTFGERAAAATLIETLASRDAVGAARAAAADALAEMTGLNYGPDLQQWQQWWADNQGLNPDEFHQKIVQERADHFEQEVRQSRQLAEAAQKILADVYSRMSIPEKAAALDEFLKSIAPEIRVAGAEIILDSVNTGTYVPSSAMPLLRTMVSDPSTEVRLTVAQTLYNDKEALDAMLAQLKIETDPEVKVELLTSIAPMKDLKTADVLVQMLGDPSYRVAAAAANALGELGGQLRAAVAANSPDAATEAMAVRALSDALQRTAGGNPETQPLRESVVRAMATLQDPLLLRTFLDLVRSNESASVHMYAVRGLGGLKDPRMAPTIEDLLSRDSDPGVRLASVQALGAIPAPEYAGQMVDLMNGQGTDDSLRQAAWDALRNWFAVMDDTQLQSIADELHEKLPQQPDKQLGALQALADKLQKEPGSGNDLAGTRQQIGDLLMQLNRPADAAASYRQALEYWQANNGTGMTVERLTQNLMDSQLQAKQYADAAGFAATSLANHADARIVAVPLRDAAQKLVDGGDIADAQSLIAAIDKMSPPLPEPYHGDVEQTKLQLSRR